MSSGELCLFGASHHTTPLEMREKIALAAERQGEFLQRARELKEVQECVLVNTCNRLEIYAVVEPESAGQTLLDFFCRFHGFDANEFTRIHFSLTGVDALRHLMEVASGVDSQIVGETEVFGQVKAAYSLAAENHSVGPFLNRIFQKAFQASKWIRSHTTIGEGQVSIATVAVDLATKIFGDLSASRVLVIGMGDIGEKTLKALRSRRAKNITLSNRTLEKAQSLAETFAGSVLPFDRLADELRHFDIIITSASAPDIVLPFEMVENALRRRPRRPFFLIDLAMPRNIDARVTNLNSIFLYNLDDLAKIADENLAHRLAETARCRELIKEKAAAIWTRLPAPDLPPSNLAAQRNQQPA